MSLKEKLHSFIGDTLQNIAPIQTGVVVSYNRETNMAMVRCPDRTGTAYTLCEVRLNSLSGIG